MMPLEHAQAVVRQAILFGDTSCATGLIDPAGLAPGRRLQIHRNHYLASLAEALAATYPVVARLIGWPCFKGLAREFVMLSPPAGPCLFEYGAAFACYLEAVPTLGELPYLPDVARLEWAMNAARHAADAAPLEPAALAGLPRERCLDLTLTLHRACRLVASGYPIDRIWRANQPGADPDVRIGLGDGGVRLLVHRDRDGDAAWLRLSSAAFLFVHALRKPLPVAEAWARASEEDPGFNGAGLLAALFDAGLLIDFDDSKPQL
jgi:hypothetical protein